MVDDKHFKVQIASPESGAEEQILDGFLINLAFRFLLSRVRMLKDLCMACKDPRRARVVSHKKLEKVAGLLHSVSETYFHNFKQAWSDAYCSMDLCLVLLLQQI